MTDEYDDGGYRLIHRHATGNPKANVIDDLRVPDWMQDAACASIGFELFFTDESGQKSREERAAHKACEECEVRSQCLQFAVDNRIEYGVYGGMSSRPRRALWVKVAS